MKPTMDYQTNKKYMTSNFHPCFLKSQPTATGRMVLVRCVLGTTCLTCTATFTPVVHMHLQTLMSTQLPFYPFTCNTPIVKHDYTNTIFFSIFLHSTLFLHSPSIPNFNFTVPTTTHQTTGSQWVPLQPHQRSFRMPFQYFQPSCTSPIPHPQLTSFVTTGQEPTVGRKCDLARVTRDSMSFEFFVLCHRKTTFGAVDTNGIVHALPRLE